MTLTESDNLIRLTEEQVKPMARILASAFQDYPLWDCIFPDSLKRAKKCLPSLFEFLTKYCVRYGEVYATPNFEGAVLWLPPNKIHMSMIGMMRAGGWVFPFQVGWKAISKLMTSMKFTEGTHNRLMSSCHWYLFFLGVDTIHRGKGYAGALLRPMLARIDKEGLSCYLETQDEKIVPFYEYFGFEVTEKASIPGLDITNWAMLR